MLLTAWKHSEKTDIEVLRHRNTKDYLPQFTEVL